MKYPQLAILIPCHNKQERIVQVIEEAQHFGTVIVIDNASTDNSYHIAKDTGVTVVKEYRFGYGAAVMTGILEAKRMEKSVGIILEADLSDNPADIPILVEPVLNEGIDLCISTRTRLEDQINFEPHQRFGNQFAVWLMRLKTGYRYRDLGPFRAFKIPKILGLNMEDEHSGWNIEMQIKSAQQGLAIREIELPYRRQEKVPSNFSTTLKNSIKVGVQILRTVSQH